MLECRNLNIYKEDIILVKNKSFIIKLFNEIFMHESKKNIVMNHIVYRK